MKKDNPSRTAYKVALNVLTLGTKPGTDKIFPQETVESTAKLLVASGAVSPRRIRWFRSKRRLSVCKAFDWMMPGQFDAFARRKAFCERAARDGIGAGASQILVLGAGYDTLGWRLAPKFTGVRFFEIDHPGTARLKAKGITAMGQPDNLYLIAEDLAKRKLADVLTNNKAWDPRAGTVIIAEGLVMYLPPEAVRDLFCQCNDITGTGSRIAFSYIPTAANGRPDAGPCSGLMLWLLRKSGEPWLWSIRPEELGAFLEQTGWTIDLGLTGTTAKHGVEFYCVAEKQHFC